MQDRAEFLLDFDALGAPRYEAVDTGFWFILALYRYQEITTDSSLVSELMPAVRAIMGALQKGRPVLPLRAPCLSW